MTINIKQVSDAAAKQLKDTEDKDWPVPGNAAQSAAYLIFQAGVEAMREAAVRNLRTQGFNIHANQTLDIKV